MAKRTRAELYGVKPGVLAAKSKRLVQRARTAIAELSAAWDDVYQAVAFDAELLIERLDELSPVIEEGATYLREPVEGDDHG